jgi:energy-coupling factor transporter ATP-binding protein EcfA2
MSTPGATGRAASVTGDVGVAVALQDVMFAYPRAGRSALSSVSLTVRTAEAVVIAGESGSGKSTLARLVVGVLRATEGSVRIGGMDVAVARRHEITSYAGLVFQNPNHQLFASTVRDELALGPRNLGLRAADVADRVAAAAHRLELEPFLDEHPYRLGVAIRKRVALAAVLAMRPRVLVLDEPTTGQGRREAEGIATLLREEAIAGTTVIAISHDMGFAAEIANRVVVLREGRVWADGQIRELLGDEELMVAGGLEPPQVARLARRLGLARTDGLPLTTDELLQLLGANRPNDATGDARP